jgi:GNAT superfamily N-acetyltransferase
LTSIRPAGPKDHNRVWAILEPIFRAGDTYALEPNIRRNSALAYWMGGTHKAFVALDGDESLGTYYIGPNHLGGGDHVCNCGFATDPAARGKGVAREMLAHALDTARADGYRAMQFNFVATTNLGALKIWYDNGFEQVGCLPKAFNHPTEGYVDALVLFKTL